MTALAVRSAATSASLQDQMRYAEALAGSGLLPAQYRRQPANLLYAISYAEMLGTHPLTAVTGIHVIDGKPSASAALISALVRRAGHRLRVTGDDTHAVAEIVRADDPEFTFRAEWTLDRAKQAGLTGKGVWRQYPAAMLKARAITEVARDACEDALAGLHYTAEELGAEVDAEGNLTAQALARQVYESAPAERGVVSADADPWAGPALPTTDASWMQSWLRRVAERPTAGVLRGLWAEMAEQHKIGRLADTDRDACEQAWLAARQLGADAAGQENEQELAAEHRAAQADEDVREEQARADAAAEDHLAGVQ